MGSGQQLWKTAKRIIPGGNMLLSKRAEMFLPEKWPSYFSKAKGCHIWDLDNRKLLDVSIMGIGTNLLGYGHKKVDEAVRKTINKGNMSTLNCPEEVMLAEKLVELHPWAGKVRFSRSGGEANAIAIRIARAATGKDKVAICGYHGWHDWYLATNIENESNLEGHLLPGLEPNGVPKCLEGTVLPFEFNNLKQLESIVQNHELAAIKMEVQRNDPPNEIFLKRIRNICNQKGIVLIFDECTSGFRETYGGIHKKFNIEPDMAMFGKALGNGYAITSVIGKTNIMDAVQKTFISSTFWTERIGPSAALKTLEVMKEIKSWEIVTNIGLKIKSSWKKVFNENKLDYFETGIPALAGFTFKSNHNLIYKTYITQEMLKRNILAANSIFVCVEHKDRHLNRYFEELNKILKIIKLCEEDKIDPQSILDGPTCHSGFKRLN